MSKPAAWHPWRSNTAAKPVVATRTCVVCGETKPIDQYGRSGGGRRSTCIPCFNAAQRVAAMSPERAEQERARNRERYRRDPDAKIASNARWRQRRRAQQEAAAAGTTPISVPRRWYDTIQAALELDRSISTVVNDCRSGRLRAMKTTSRGGGLCWRIDPESVRQLKAAQKH